MQISGPQESFSKNLLGINSPDMELRSCKALEFSKQNKPLSKL